MFYVLSWFLVSGLVALWSLAASALHAVAVWSVSNAGTLSGVAQGAEGLRLPVWLSPWVPPEEVEAMTALLTDLAPVVDSLLQTMPALSGSLTAVMWAIWGLGTALLILLGAGLHVMIAMWRRRRGGYSGPQHARRLAA